MRQNHWENKMKTIMMYYNKNNNNLYLKRRWNSECMAIIMGLMVIRAQLVVQGTGTNKTTIEIKKKRL